MGARSLVVTCTAEPAEGRRRPANATSPAGLWLANQLCDLVQIRTHPTGTAVRLVMRRAHRARRDGWAWAVA